ncbi:hypothetical protein PSTT_04404 [Puccinia striiformis]|uniref:Uncharacterized protein n=1 Tax=Puccinia striiformis TaxID=27350 RepID=A0A2S4VTL7_9BASI|nr:hypothetical protein PSTT_04404 [Puccinia striiformis]
MSPSALSTLYDTLRSHLESSTVLFHKQTLKAKYESQHYDEEVHKRENWVKEAKRAWQSKQLSNSVLKYIYPSLHFLTALFDLCAAQAAGVNNDPDSPSFDLEAFLNQLSTVNQ